MKIADNELTILEPIHDMWLARDKNGTLCLFYDKPKRVESFFHGDYWDSAYGTIDFSQYNHLFKWLSWDNEPIFIEDFVKECKKDARG